MSIVSSVVQNEPRFTITGRSISAMYNLIIAWQEMEKLWQLGFPKADNLPPYHKLWCDEVTVSEIIDTGLRSRLYCFTVPLNNACVVNGILLG